MQPHGQQFAEQLQQKLQGQDNSHKSSTSTVATADADLTLAATSQPGTAHQNDVRHHKASHAHFADHDDSNAMDKAVTGRHESITAVRPAAGKGSFSHAEGSFWRTVDAGPSYSAASGQAWCLPMRCLVLSMHCDH